MRPTIGLAGVYEPAAWSVWKMDAILAPANYVQAVQQAGGFAVIIPVDAEIKETARQTIEQIDGLMLLGGVDVHPSHYGETPHKTTTDPIIERDQFELALLKEAIYADKPVLAICRGMQLLNVAYAGTLTQHLPEKLGHSDHRRHLGTFKDTEHPVKVIENSLLHTVTNCDEIIVKSHHHQGVATVGNGLQVSARSPQDNLVEALELPEKRFVLGVQWHPEADADSSVIAAFVAAAQRQLYAKS